MNKCVIIKKNKYPPYICAIVWWLKAPKLLKLILNYDLQFSFEFSNLISFWKNFWSVLIYRLWIFRIILLRRWFDTKYIFNGVKMVQIKSFPSPRQVALPKLKNNSLFYFSTASKDEWIHAFSKITCAKWKANNLIQNMTSGCWFHFFQW